MESTISSKGQVTVPVEAREKLGLRPGTKVEFELTESGLLLRKKSPADHPVDRLYGVLDLGRAVDEILEETRGPGSES